MMLRWMLCCLLVVLTGACAGPRAPLEVDMKGYPTDVILGTQSRPPQASPTIDSGIPIPIQALPLRRSPDLGPVPQTPEHCPQAHPFAAPKIEKGNTSNKPPIPQTLTYRNKGTFDLFGYKGAFPSESVRSVSNVVKEPTGAFRYEVIDGATTTGYRVDPASGQGIFMTKQETKTGTTTDSFIPTPAIKLLDFPAEPGKAWDSTGTDSRNATTMVLHGAVGATVDDDNDGKPDDKDANGVPDIVSHVRVDACGEPLDAWLIQISGPGGTAAARIVSPTKNLNFSAVYAFATQFGGLSIMDFVKLDGTISGNTVRTENKAIISTVPPTPQ